jgi:hypothetical protein
MMKPLAQSRDDLIRSSLACFDCAFEITLSVDGSVFAAEMDVDLRLSFDAGKTGVLPDLPVAVAAATVRITLPPIHCGKTIPVGAQPRQYRLNLGENSAPCSSGVPVSKVSATWPPV